jgi:hypothetical protein
MKHLKSVENFYISSMLQKDEKRRKKKEKKNRKQNEIEKRGGKH